MFKKIIVKGNSSNSTLKIIKMDSKQDSSLMDFLRSIGIPIASSCYGEGVCKKCLINEDIVSCQLKVKDFIQISEKYNDTISISYL